jgi:BON domain
MGEGFMKRIECVLLMVSMMSLGLAAQAPKSRTDGEAAGPAKPEVAQQTGGEQDSESTAQQKTTEAAAVSTSMSASASFSPLAADASTPSVSRADTELQAQIQQALSKDPMLSKCSVVVSASPDAIDLTGNAGTSRERLAAWRLAESYARGKKVENHIVVNGQGTQATAPSRPENGASSSHPAPSIASSPGIRNNRQ